MSSSCAAETRNRGITLWATLGFAFMGGTCAPPPGLGEAILASCESSTLYLSSWWSGSAVEPLFDPVGGYVFVYWVDAEGTACHGEPGVSGQPGPVVFTAESDEALAATRNASVLTEADLARMQEVGFTSEWYRAPGPHFLQVAVRHVRVRGSGKAANLEDLIFSSSTVTDLEDGAFCAAPVAAVTGSRFDCVTSMGAIGIPDVFPSQGQDPNHCQVRAAPTSAQVSATERTTCIADLPSGMKVTEQP